MRTLILIITIITLVGCGSSINNKSSSTQERIVDYDKNISKFKYKKDRLYYKNKLFTGIEYSQYTKARKCWLKFYTKYRNGVLHGVSKVYYCNGQLQGEKTYAEGKLLSEKEWNEEGKLIIHKTY